MGIKRAMLAFGRATGAWRIPGIAYGPHRVVVLAYHRIAESGAEGYDDNRSATVDEFAGQMGWIADHLTPIAVDDLVAAVAGGPLPPRPVLVTFDDGYRDNLVTALPIMERHGIRPVVFLATDHIDRGAAFWWDRAADAFAGSPLREAMLPLLGNRRWIDPGVIAHEWVAAAKEISDGQMRDALATLEGLLGAEGRRGPDLLSWADVATMASRGVSFGAHTCRHPILTRVDPEDARAEIAGSIARVREVVGTAPAGFAYPNGRSQDVDDGVERMVHDAGVPTAFTLVPGPARLSEVRGRPLRIRRIYIHHGDGLDRFVAKVAGVPRLVRLPL